MVDVDRAVVARARVADVTEGLRAEGLSEEHAEREALARLGSPDALADEIRRAHQTTRRALAAAGAGVVAAAQGGFLGLAVTYASLLIGWAALFALLTVLQPLIGPVNFQM